MERRPSAQFGIDVMQQRVCSLVSVEASIGAGKSRLLDALMRLIREAGLSAIASENKGAGARNGIRHRFLYVEEPIKSWTQSRYGTGYVQDGNAEEQSIFELYNQDMKKYAFLFQVKAFTSRLATYRDQIGRLLLEEEQAEDEALPLLIHVISERSPAWGDRCFFRHCYESGLATHAEWEIYDEFSSMVTSQIAAKTHALIYLPTSPTRCLERIRQRGRKGEEFLDLTYLDDLHRQHQHMLSQFKQSGENKRVFALERFEDEMSQDEIDREAATLFLSLLAHCSNVAADGATASTL